jgi:hypothetical protein
MVQSAIATQISIAAFAPADKIKICKSLRTLLVTPRTLKPSPTTALTFTKIITIIAKTLLAAWTTLVVTTAEKSFALLALGFALFTNHLVVAFFGRTTLPCFITAVTNILLATLTFVTTFFTESLLTFLTG